MALFENRTEEEILSALLAQLVAQTELIDLSEGSVMLHILRTFARETSHVELRMRILRDAISLMDADGTDLDERVAELPPPELTRLGASPASGSTIQVTLDNTDGLVIPEGTVYGRSDDPTIKYIQTEDVTVPLGYSTWPADPPPTGTDAYIPVVASVPGVRSNAKPGVINQLVSGPSSIVTVSNKVLIEGQDEETDDALRNRALLYLAGIPRCQPQALEYVALTFVSSDGERFKSATAFEDPSSPGYTELVVDGPVSTSPGNASSGTVPEGDSYLYKTLIYHDFPVAYTPGVFELSLKVNGIVANKDDYISIPERGIIIPLDGLFEPGDTWSIDKFIRYTGAIAELQSLIEGDIGDPTSSNGAGFRASGTRVRVIPVTVQTLTELQANITVFDGFDINDLKDICQTEVYEYVSSLAPGKPLLIASIIQRLMNLRGVENVSVISPANDVYPASHRHVIRMLTQESVEIT